LLRKVAPPSLSNTGKEATMDDKRKACPADRQHISIDEEYKRQYFRYWARTLSASRTEPAKPGKATVKVKP